MRIEKTIEKIKDVKSELDSAFDKGQIDLDQISDDLKSVIDDLESVRDRDTKESLTRDIEKRIIPSFKRSGRRPSIHIQDYR